LSHIIVAAPARGLRRFRRIRERIGEGHVVPPPAVAADADPAHLGINPIVALEKQRLNMIRKLV
jgi:hypothetical protein